MDAHESNNIADHTPLRRIISEEEFKKPLMQAATTFFTIANYIIYIPEHLTARFYFNFMNEADKFETFLDDYGTQDNNRWYHFAELIASVRNFSVASFEIIHIISRYREYFPDDDSHDAEEFLTHSKEVLAYIAKIEADLIKEAEKEMERQGCPLDASVLQQPDSFDEISTSLKLPNDISMDEYETTEERVMRIAESYRKIAIKMHREKYGTKPSVEELVSMIPASLSETSVKVLENSLHAIQSEYDTHIRKTGLEKYDPDMRKFRSYISVPMHLLEAGQWIIHFYERHENQIHQDVSKNKIATIVDKELTLKILSDFCFFYAHKYIMDGKLLSEKIMSRFLRSTKIELPLPKPEGLHARPAYYITLVVEEHGTDVFMYVGDRKFDARSVLELLEAGGLAMDEEQETVVFEGDERAINDMKILAEHNYCEDKPIPKELFYIRVARNIMT